MKSIAVPTRHGFGTTLVKATFPDAPIDYAVKGLSCEIEIPLGQNLHDQMEGKPRLSLASNLG